MRKLISSSILLAALSSCMTGPNPGSGFFYTDIKGPNHAASGKVDSSKRGESCASVVLGVAAFGDASIEAARKKGSITNVAAVDYSTFSVFGFLYQKTCAIVSGS